MWPRREGSVDERYTVRGITDVRVVDDGKPLIRVFLVDDHEIVRQCVRDLLEVSGGFAVVGEEGGAVGAARSILDARPDVALVDLRLGDGSGIEVCRQVRAGRADIATLILTADDAEQAAVAAALAGAFGFVLKLVLGGQLVATVREAAAADHRTARSEAARVLDRLQQEHARELNRLTSDEACVLELIGKGLDDTELAAEMELPPAVISRHVSTLLEKLDFASRTRMVAGGSRHDLWAESGS